MNRRTYLLTATTATSAAAAGCFGGDDPNDETGENETDGNASDDGDVEGEDPTGGPPAQPTVENPPDVVYLPTHRESMRVLDPVEAGDYTLAPMLSYPHRFWLVSGDEIQEVEREEDGGVHLMFTLWDAETGVVLPAASGAQVRLYRDGERVGQPRSLWRMLSQEMGFHFGDNVALEGDGTYTVEVTLPPLSVETTGALAGRFTESATVEFTFAYDDAFRREVRGGIEYLPEAEWGEPGALEPMDHGGGHGGDGERDDADTEGDGHGEHHRDGHGVPYSALPPADSYPGTLLGEPESGDAVFVTALLGPGSRFVDGEERYLLVSPRTPYNRVPLPDLALRATVERDGDTVADRELLQRIDGELDLHYGVALEDVRAGDDLTLAVESIPQVARHQGYETAFVEMPPMELTVPDSLADGGGDGA